jgi:hypothetical protein
MEARLFNLSFRQFGVEKASVIGSTMANEQSFTPEEWAKVLESAMLAGIAVSEAEPSGLWGTLKEYFANTSALYPSKLDPDANELIKAVIDDSTQRKEGARSKNRCASSSPVRTSRLNASNARSPACTRSRRSSTPRRLTTQLRSKPGYAALVSEWQRPRRRAASSVLEAIK